MNPKGLPLSTTAEQRPRVVPAKLDREIAGCLRWLSGLLSGSLRMLIGRVYAERRTILAVEAHWSQDLTLP